MEHLHIFGQTLKHPPLSSPFRFSYISSFPNLPAHSARLAVPLGNRKLFQFRISVLSGPELLGYESQRHLSPRLGGKNSDSSSEFCHRRGVAGSANEACMAIAPAMETKGSCFGDVCCRVLLPSSKRHKIKLCHCRFKIFWLRSYL